MNAGEERKAILKLAKAEHKRRRILERSGENWRDF